MNVTLHNNVILAKETLLGAGAVIGNDSIEQGVYLPPKTILLGKKSNELDF